VVDQPPLPAGLSGPAESSVCVANRETVALYARHVAGLPDVGLLPPMSSPPASLPPELSRLLSAREGPEQEEAWSHFLSAHSSLLVHTCRTIVRDRDAAMDGYAHVLEKLREECYRRLRAYTPQLTTRFSTWLVVVARRLLLDYQRHRYGRPRTDDETRREERAVRRRLEDLVVTEIDPDQLATSSSNSPDLRVRREELTRVLYQALDELEPSDRLLLALRFEDERPVREIAATMGLPTVFHVYRRVGVALSELRRALVRRGVEGSEP
jgi:RNA polymerase sigma factor (sigma-70 family)